MTAKTPTSAPGNKPGGPGRPPRNTAGFTLVELLLVLMLIALVSGLAGLALRDGGESRLEREALRLSALLEAGRAEARATGVAVRFELAGSDSQNGGNSADGGDDFRFADAGAGTKVCRLQLDRGCAAGQRQVEWH